MKKINNKKKGISNENLVADSENESEYAFENNAGTTAEVEVYANETDLSYEDKSYVMQKFLENESSSKVSTNKNSSAVKHAIIDDDDNDVESNISKISNETYKVSVPVPKPRKQIFKEMKDNNINDSPPSNSEVGNAPIQDSTIVYKNTVKYENETKPKQSKNKKFSTVREDNSNSLTKERRQEKMPRKGIPIENEKDIDEVENEENDETDSNNKKNNDFSKEHNSNEILTVTIRKTDRLLLNSYVFCAATIVYFIDGETGDFIKKSNPQRSVIIKNMEHDSFVDYIERVSTKNYNLVKNRELIPNWNETLIINENFSYLQNYSSMIIFFEMIESSKSGIAEDSDDRIIAWGFLKPKHNYNENLRLQLYYPQSSKNKHKCKAYTWWKKKKMTKYPSTLYVTLTKTELPSQNAAENEISAKISTDNNIRQEDDGQITKEELLNLKLQIKKPIENQAFRIPNEKLCEIETSGNGCFVHKFSNTGDLLAVATSKENMANIIIYETCSLHKICELQSHQNLIYDIAWTSNNTQILTASSDCTVIIWDVTLQKLEYIFPHPTFVYCCAPATASTDNYFASGSYDKCIRIWSITSYALMHELRVHKGYITSICFNRENYFMYSADSSGSIIMWHKELDKWTTKKVINVLDLNNVIINQIILHRRERRILVNSRDGMIRLIDIKTGYVLQSYIKGSNEKANIKCATTPCDTYLLSGSQNGDIFIWNVDNGKTELVHSPYQVKIPIHCVQIHPKHNLFAISHFGSNFPVILYGQHTKPLQELEGTSKPMTKSAVNNNDSMLRKQGTNFRMILEKFDNFMK